MSRDWIDRGLSDDEFELMRAEDMVQIEKWGEQTHSPAEWLMFLAEEVGELAEAIADHMFRDNCGDDVIKEAVQVATLALKIAQMYREAEEKRVEEVCEEDMLAAHEADRWSDDQFMSGNY